jgi:hypothetical protein
MNKVFMVIYMVAHLFKFHYLYILGKLSSSLGLQINV